MNGRFGGWMDGRMKWMVRLLGWLFGLSWDWLFGSLVGPSEWELKNWQQVTQWYTYSCIQHTDTSSNKKTVVSLRDNNNTYLLYLLYFINNEATTKHKMMIIIIQLLNNNCTLLLYLWEVNRKFHKFFVFVFFI